MAGSSPPESLQVFLRAAEGLGLLLLVLVFFAAGSCRERLVSRRERYDPRVSRSPGRTV
ncbi:MAG: hypothetical protein LUO98_02750 [Methanoregula sp.]|nr:hypothetical protein [Methanoregula sp.]